MTSMYITFNLNVHLIFSKIILSVVKMESLFTKTITTFDIVTINSLSLAV